MKKKKTNKKVANYFDMLITNRNPKSPVSEAFRTVRTNVEFSDIDKNIRTLVTTSATPGEGKSTVTANLGVTMAMSGKSVILIDADLRNPTLHKIFNVRNAVGLTNLIVNQSLQLEEAIVSPRQNLHFLASGPLPPNPAELLSSQKMRDFIAGLTEIFDIVILDAPPILAVTDAVILSTYIDGVILVAAAGQAPKDVVLSAKEQLTKVKANILGVVLNKVPQGNGMYYYHYHYGN